MGTDADESLLRDLTWPLVSEFSPAEGDLFGLLSEAHFADPKAYTSKNKGGGPLAFGFPELTVLLTPVMLAAMNEVVRYVVARATEKGSKVTAKTIRRLLGRGRGDAEPTADEPLSLTTEQWADVRKIVERVARNGGVSADQAQLIADAVVGQGRTGTASS